MTVAKNTSLCSGPFWLFLEFIPVDRAEIPRVPYEQTTEFFPVIESARLKGSYSLCDGEGRMYKD